MESNAKIRSPRSPKSVHPLSGHPMAQDLNEREGNHNHDEPREEVSDRGDDEPLPEIDDSGKQLTPEDLVEMPAWKRFVFSKWGCAVLLTLLTIVLLLIIRPAFFLKKRDNLLEKPRVNWLVVFITSIVLFAAYAGIPALVVYCKKKWVGKDK